MAPRKRRAEDDLEYSREQSPQASNTQSRRHANADSEDDGDEEGVSQMDYSQFSGVHPDVKKMVRLALASEYSRQVIRRSDMSQKVLGERSRQFKSVFDKAQESLKNVFGMEMVEQPAKEKFSISQRRAAQRVEKASTSNKTWTLVTTLPARYRIPEILPPSRAPSTSVESSYIALYSFIIALISLSGGSIAEAKLDRYLRRVNADNFTPVDRTDKLLARLCKEGYLVRNRDVDTGEEIVEYYVGPRGKVEVGLHGVAGMAREVYGFGRTYQPPRDGDDKEMDQFEKRLERSLGIAEKEALSRTGAGAEPVSQGTQPGRRSRREVAVEDDDERSDS